MDSTNCWSSVQEVLRAQRSREELIGRLAQAIQNDGMTEPVEGVRFCCASASTEIGHGISDPSLCVIVQGSKGTTTERGVQLRRNSE